MILYIWRIQIWKQFWMICTSNVINFPLSLLNLLCYSIFIWIFRILHNQRIQIFQQIRTICTSNVHNFSLSFHSFVHSTNSNFKQIHAIYTSNVHIFHGIFIILYFQQKHLDLAFKFRKHDFTKCFMRKQLTIF